MVISCKHKIFGETDITAELCVHFIHAIIVQVKAGSYVTIQEISYSHSDKTLINFSARSYH